MSDQQEHNKETVRKAIAAFNKQDLDEFWSYHTEDTTSHEVYFPEPLTKAQMSEFVPKLWASYPDWTIETKTMIAQGDTVVVENIMTATFVNDFEGQKATGKTFSVREAVFFEFKGDKIKDVRVFLDRQSQEEQLGTA
jgi:steroid delta-isomerase-like uncharacterized protein